MPRTLPSAQETVRILARRRTRPMPGPPPAAGRALARTMKALEGRFGQGAGALEARWREIVGEELARRTEPSKLIKSRREDGATLELRVEGPSAAIIQHRGPDILERVNLFLGAGAVARLRIVQGPLRGRGRRGGPSPAPARRRPAGPLDAAAERTLADDLAGFAEGRLKTALTRLGREIMRDHPRDV
ncbi:MAG TPA: DciA family protein [Caulobacteraceae bacterium]|nr:DciA family protein [Caulobacteraceae bacterium]